MLLASMLLITSHVQGFSEHFAWLFGWESFSAAGRILKCCLAAVGSVGPVLVWGTWASFLVVYDWILHLTNASTIKTKPSEYLEFGCWWGRRGQTWKQ